MKYLRLILHSHINKTNTINTVYYVIKIMLQLHTLRDYRYVTLLVE